jgi:hypothetical protein
MNLNINQQVGISAQWNIEVCTPTESGEISTFPFGTGFKNNAILNYFLSGIIRHVHAARDPKIFYPAYFTDGFVQLGTGTKPIAYTDSSLDKFYQETNYIRPLGNRVNVDYVTGSGLAIFEKTYDFPTSPGTIKYTEAGFRHIDSAGNWSSFRINPIYSRFLFTEDCQVTGYISGVLNENGFSIFNHPLDKVSGVFAVTTNNSGAQAIRQYEINPKIIIRQNVTGFLSGYLSYLNVFTPFSGQNMSGYFLSGQKYFFPPKFYPKIPNADKITIHHLLHHRTGIPDFLNDDPTVGEFIYVENKKEDLVKRIENYTSAFEPNSQHKYSNSNYNLLGYIIEDITKKSFSENVNTRIVKKIGLKNTLFPTKIDITKNEGYSYFFDGKNWAKVPEWHSSLSFTAGAMASTTDDLNLFLEALLEGKLTSKSSLEQMKSMEDYYGKGLIIAPFENRKFYGHTGGIENFRAAAGYNPEDKTGFAIIVNGDNYNRNDIMIGVLSLFYGSGYSFPEFKQFEVSKAVLEKYVGTYKSAAFPMKIKVFVENGNLLAQATGQSSFLLTAKSETEFVFEAAMIQLTFGENKMNFKQGTMEFEFIKE